MTSWRPSAEINTLKKRAELFDIIRAFFKTRQVLEVETPLLCQHTVTDQYIESFATDSGYLQTSPEYAMKRLLAAGSGPIFQITKAFRREEQGHQHNREFTLLEWYQPNYSHHDLMDEMDALLQTVATFKPAQRWSYETIFEKYCQVNPHTCTENAITEQLSDPSLKNIDRVSALQLLFSEKIEPHLGHEAPAFIYDFPSNQAALAKLSPEHPHIAHRFEVFIQGKEIANGFHELTDPVEQKQRFLADQQARKTAGKFVPIIDRYFIEALEQGLPECSGVALGVDRLLMCILDKKNISEVISFNDERA